MHKQVPRQNKEQASSSGEPKSASQPSHHLLELNETATDLADAIQVQNTLENEWGRYRHIARHPSSSA